MKTILLALGVLFALSGYAAMARAEGCCDSKKTVADNEVVLQGNLTCGKCELGEGDKCNDVLVVKDGEKEVRYSVALGESLKAKHVCKGTKAVKITGTVAEKDGKKTITATKVEDVEAKA